MFTVVEDMGDIGTYNITMLFLYCRFIVDALLMLVMDEQAYRWVRGLVNLN